MHTPTTNTRRPLSRRTVLMGTAAAAGATALLPMAAGSAAAAPLAPPKAAARPLRTGRLSRGASTLGKQHGADLPDAATRHVLSRFTAGLNAARVAEVVTAGGIDAWFAQQLSPNSITDPAADATWNWFPVLAMTPLQRWERYKSGIEPGWAQMQDLASWTMMRRLLTKRQLLEAMTDFWTNLLHVPTSSDGWVYRVEYQNMIRAGALGSFDALLKSAITHPSMGLYLDNVDSTATAINENLGREVLECHTVGVGAPYTENDVVNSARILTGFSIDTKGDWTQTYVPSRHWTGRVKVMTFKALNDKPDGQAVLNDYLTFLAKSSYTAKRICQRLAVRFVSDQPSDALVTALAKVYTANGTQIIPVLQAIVDSDEFKAAALSKVRTPVEDSIATWNALQANVAQPKNPQDAGNQFINVSKAIGQVVFDWPAPNGFPDVAPAWTGAGRMLGSMRTHWYASGGFWPNSGITFPSPVDWMPQLPERFDNIVSYVVEHLLFLPCTQTMLDAACAATDHAEHDVIDASDSLVKFKFPRLMVSLLDTPEHLSR